ncbi:MAG: hypothetical protein Q4B28_01325 [bacterium]|nr:hypothetical protein [bacterium]
MEIKKINPDAQQSLSSQQRPSTFSSFLGQEPIKSVLETAIHSAKLR